MTSEFGAEINWTRNDARFTGGHYSRGHTWSFDGGQVIAASASPHIVPLPHSVPENVDPEEAYVAALSSCHMLFFLSLAADRGLIVDSYSDSATGLLSVVDGVASVTRIDLHPRVTYAGSGASRELELELHHLAHDRCFLANSVRTVIETHVMAARSDGHAGRR
ncbi:MAG: OsmC family protein [Pseudomonadota bacterium]|nr:OsmC family protein [Pseudomonadota bacterium]